MVIEQLSNQVEGCSKGGTQDCFSGTGLWLSGGNTVTIMMELIAIQKRKLFKLTF